jgi:hypothetical protein
MPPAQSLELVHPQGRASDPIGRGVQARAVLCTTIVGCGAGIGGRAVMDFDGLLDQVLALLQREKRLAYRVLKRWLQLDNETLEDLKDDLIYAKIWKELKFIDTTQKEEVIKQRDGLKWRLFDLSPVEKSDKGG